MLSKLFIAATVLAAGVNAAQVDVDDYDDMAMQVRLMANHSTPFTAVTTMTFTSVNSSAVVMASLRATNSFNTSFISAISTAINNQAATVTLTAEVTVADGRRQLEESAEERELQTAKTLTQPWSAAGLDAAGAAAAKTAVEGTTAATAIATSMGTAISAAIGETVTVTVTTAATVGGGGGGAGSPAAPTPATSFAAGKSIAFGLYAVMMALVAMMMA